MNGGTVKNVIMIIIIERLVVAVVASRDIEKDPKYDFKYITKAYIGTLDEEMSEDYKVYVFGRGVSARHLSKESAKTLVSMWREIGFRAKVQLEHGSRKPPRRLSGN